MPAQVSASQSPQGSLIPNLRWRASDLPRAHCLHLIMRYWRLLSSFGYLRSFFVVSLLKWCKVHLRQRRYFSVWLWFEVFRAEVWNYLERSYTICKFVDYLALKTLLNIIDRAWQFGLTCLKVVINLPESLGAHWILSSRCTSTNSLRRSINTVKRFVKLAESLHTFT